MRFRLLLIALMVPLLLWPMAARGDGDVIVTFQHASQTASDVEARKFTPRSGSVLTGVWKVVVNASTGPLGLKKFEVSIISIPPTPPPVNGRVSGTKPYGLGETTQDTIAFEWDTNRITPSNGVYRIEANADGHSGKSTKTQVNDLKVNNPAAPPTGLVAKVADNVPSLSWKASPEVDVLRYTVLRSEGGNAYKEVGSPTATSFTDSQAPKETLLTYKVAAVRYSPVTPTGVVGYSSDPTSGLRLFMPTPSAGQGAAGAIGATAEIPTFTGKAPSPKPTVIELKHKGFAESLPYQNVPSAGDVAGNEGPSAASILSAPARLLENTVRKPPYIAAAFLMIVVALHAFRLGRRLSKPEGTPSLT
jgi:hypothetical protein